MRLFGTESKMASSESQNKSTPRRAGGARQTGGRRLYSIAAWPEQRAFVGTISLGSQNYKFSYTPSRAQSINNLLELSGPLTVTDARGRARSLKSVRATLANAQGGVGTGPLRRQMIASDAPIGDQTTSQQKQQAAG